MSSPSFPVVAAFVASFLMAYLFTSPAVADWSTEVVETETNYGALGVSLALDADGNPHLAYFKQHIYLHGQRFFRYARRQAGVWEASTIMGPDPKALGRENSIAIDAAGNPHIAYHDWEFGKLRYAYWDGADWQSLTIVVDDGGSNPSLAIDKNGWRHISHYDANLGALKYAFSDGAVWDTRVVDNTGDVGEHSSIAVDPSGNPHIAYWDSGNGDLKYARWDGAAWQIETVDSAGEVGRYVSLAIDAAGNSHISYLDETDIEYYRLKYARRDGSSWYVEIVPDPLDVGMYNSLALDPQGHPHIAYRNSATHGIRYAYWDGVQWNIEAVTSYYSSLGGDNVSLAIDGQGNRYVAYHRHYAIGIVMLATAGPVEPRRIGDFDGNGDVDSEDAAFFVRAFRDAHGASPQVNAACDIAPYTGDIPDITPQRDGIIDRRDVEAFLALYLHDNPS